MWRLAAVPIVSLLLSSCITPTAPRNLSPEFLTVATTLAAPVSTDEFAPSSDSRAAANTFRGRLTLATDAQQNFFALQRDALGLVTPDRPGIDELPAFDFRFIQDGSDLIPETTGPVINEHGWWEFVFTAGRVWDEAGDDGWSRAAIPFALKERREDCIHNGLLTFLYRDSGDVSNVAFQVVSQTCSYLQFELAGLLAASYLPENVPNAQQVLSAERGDREGRLPVRPISDLSSVFAGADAAAFGSVAEIDPLDMSFYGFIVDGVHYVGGCDTPYGRYPYCDEMAVPSYSTAKSVVGGLGMMLLETAYPGAASTPIAELVPECGDSWADVTIEHALDMTTGHFGSSELHGDEDAAINGRFFAADHAGKIDVACNGFSRKADPGTHLSYHTWDTYLAGTAMNAFLRRERGQGADFFDDLLVEKIWQPLGMSELAANTRRTYDSVNQPYTGFGLTWLRSDIAKIAQFIGVMDGRLDDGELLDRQLFDAIKQRNSNDPGLIAELETIRYNNGFRSFDVSSYIGCDEPTWVVVLSGFGGIIIAIMPNDTVYYYVSDGGVHRYLNAVRESHRLRPLCS